MSAASSVAAAHTHTCCSEGLTTDPVLFFRSVVYRFCCSHSPSINFTSEHHCLRHRWMLKPFTSAKSPHMSVFEQLISISVCSARSRVRCTGLGNRLSPPLSSREKNSKGGAARDDTATGRPPDTPASLGPLWSLLVFVPALCHHINYVTQTRD